MWNHSLKIRLRDRCLFCNFQTDTGANRSVSGLVNHLSCRSAYNLLCDLP
ncbi:hypothetical protein EWY76_21595 [Salmonella enterica subsp. enterica]|nr:hypothetical protein [Salmonella enterica]EAU0372894.1 hypothetical protein [Salmonella enterica]EBB4192267.1 hypothetical protein [Salmonella enterica]ECD2278614.1 hypothetical protein [Salmonella enterica subsp. enterica]